MESPNKDTWWGDQSFCPSQGNCPSGWLVIYQTRQAFKMNKLCVSHTKNLHFLF